MWKASKIVVTPSGIPADVCIWVQSAEEGWRSNFEESFPLCLLPPAYTHTPSCDSRKGKENRTLQRNWSESVRLFWASEHSCPCSFWRPAVRGCRVEDAGAGAVQGGRPARPGHRAGRLLWLAARSSSPCRTSSPHCPLVAATHPVQQVSMVIIWLFFSFLACFYLGILESPTLPCVRDLWFQ